MNGLIEHGGVVWPGAGPLVAEGEIDRSVWIWLADIGFETPAAIALVADDGGRITIRWRHLIGGRGVSLLVGINVFEQEVHPFEDIVVHPCQIINASLVSYVVGVQVVMIEEGGPAPDPLAIPIADVLAGDEKPTAISQVGDQPFVGINVARRVPGSGPDDNIVGGQLHCRGNMVGVSDGPGVVGVAFIVQGPLVVIGDTITCPNVSVNQQDGGSSLQGEVSSLLFIGDDTDLSFRLRPVAVTGGSYIVAPDRQCQGVVPIGIGGGRGRYVLRQPKESLNHADGGHEGLFRAYLKHTAHHGARRRGL